MKDAGKDVCRMTSGGTRELVSRNTYITKAKYILKTLRLKLRQLLVMPQQKELANSNGFPAASGGYYDLELGAPRKS